MKRKAFDVIVSWVGLFLAALLIVAGSLLSWAHSFIDNEVHTQLAAQKIFFPPKGSPAIAGADLQEIGGGQTYAQLSEESLAKPNDLKLAGTVAAMFKGETLRGLLLNAYAFGTMATIAGIATIAAFIAAAVMLVLGGLGLWHSRRVPTAAELFHGHPDTIPEPAGV
jgi:hypothetical protein